MHSVGDIARNEAQPQGVWKCFVQRNMNVADGAVAQATFGVTPTASQLVRIELLQMLWLELRNRNNAALLLQPRSSLNQL